MDKYDFYDYEKATTFYNERAGEYMDLAKQYIEAKEKGNEKKIKSLIKKMSLHRKQNEKYKEMAEEACFYWY